MEKVDYKKIYRSIYKVSSKEPVLVIFPELKYIAVEGTGSPSSNQFSQSLQALYGIAYTISMSDKNQDFQIPGFNKFVCPPLEGHWGVIDGMEYDGIDKSVFKWEIRILMPKFVTPEVLNKAITIISQKKDNPKFKSVNLITRPSKRRCVMLHIGSFNKEPETFKIMESFVQEKGLFRTSKNHEEIYLSDFRKVSEEKLKTILAFEV